MKTRFQFEYKIVIILLLILALVVTTGIFAYLRFTAAVAQMNAVKKSDTRLLTSKGLMNHIIEAENNVKSFSLTKDTFYLNQFYRNANLVNLKIEELHLLEKNNGKMPIELDSLDALISKKFKLLDELLFLRGKFRVEIALNKVLKELEKSANNQQTNSSDSNATSNSSKKGLLSWLFKKKSKSTAPETTAVDKALDLSMVNKEMALVKKQEDKIETTIINKELELLNADKIISSKIILILDSLEQAELHKIEKESKAATLKTQQETKRINRQIAYFCIATCILLLFMAIIILNYVRTNNLYRKALKTAKEKAEDLAKTKERFLANMSHEIRTPMNAIAGFTEQISQGPLNPEQKEQIAIIQKSTKHLLYLINDVLDISKLSSGKVKLECMPFELKSIFNDVSDFVRPLIKDKPVTFEININSDVPTCVNGDPFRLYQILLNIVGNAIKFTPKGKIQINVAATELSATHFNMQLEVMDTGIGIEAQKLKQVFQEFEQAEISTTRNYGGTGLGLSITNMLVELHNGSITMDSAPQKGTTVKITLPYEIADEKDIAFNENEIISTNALESLSILVVDDEPYNRQLISAILKKNKAKITECANGQEAFENSMDKAYDLILMDIRMPILDGISASKKIRTDLLSKCKTTPIIALTAAALDEDVKQCKAAGMNAVLLKPFKEADFYKTIYETLNIATSKAIPVSEKVESDKSIAIDKLNFYELRSVSNGDGAFYKDMIATFISGTEQGQIDLEKSIREKKWGMVAEIAHKMASPCRHLGALNVLSILRDIENKCRNLSATDEVPQLYQQLVPQLKAILIEAEKELEKGLNN